MIECDATLVVSEVVTTLVVSDDGSTIVPTEVVEEIHVVEEPNDNIVVDDYEVVFEVTEAMSINQYFSGNPSNVKADTHEPSGPSDVSFELTHEPKGDFSLFLNGVRINSYYTFEDKLVTYTGSIPLSSTDTLTAVYIVDESVDTGTSVSYRDTATEWANLNPILMLNMIGLETDTAKIKIGDGVTAWNALPYIRSEINWHSTQW